MKRLMASSVALAAAVALAACGGGSGGSTTSVAGSQTIDVRQLPGVGSVLIDQSGKAVYSSDQEATGRIVCNSACTAFWKPVSPGAGGPTAPSSAGRLGVIKRPDGSRQVTVNGKPLYTFSEDSPGKVTGNGFTDDFSGHHFIWHVIGSKGTAAGAPAAVRATATATDEHMRRQAQPGSTDHRG